MRPVQVTRFSLVLVAGFVLAAAVFARFATLAGRAPAGVRTLIEARCGGCHDVASLRLPPGGDRTEAGMRAFLDGHGHATPEENRRIAAYISGREERDGR